MKKKFVLLCSSMKKSSLFPSALSLLLLLLPGMLAACSTTTVIEIPPSTGATLSVPLQSALLPDSTLPESIESNEVAVPDWMPEGGPYAYRPWPDADFSYERYQMDAVTKDADARAKEMGWVCLNPYFDDGSLTGFDGTVSPDGDLRVGSVSQGKLELAAIQFEFTGKSFTGLTNLTIYYSDSNCGFKERVPISAMTDAAISRQAETDIYTFPSAFVWLERVDSVLLSPGDDISIYFDDYDAKLCNLQSVNFYGRIVE